MPKKILAVVVLLALAVSVVALAQSPVLIHGVDTNGSLQKMVTDTSGRLLLSDQGMTVTPALGSDSFSTLYTSDSLPCVPPDGSGCLLVYGPGSGSNVVNWQAYQNLSLFIQNTGSNNLVQVILEWAPTADGPWSVWEYSVFVATTFPPGEVRTIQISGNSRPFFRIEARGSTTTMNATGVAVWLFGN